MNVKYRDYNDTEPASILSCLYCVVNKTVGSISNQCQVEITLSFFRCLYETNFKRYFSFGSLQISLIHFQRGMKQNTTNGPDKHEISCTTLKVLEQVNTS